MLKDIPCGEVTEGHVGSIVTLAGWVHRRRLHGGVVFIDLRDRSGIVQLVFNPEISPGAHQVAEQVRSEWVIQVKGLVRRRPEGSENPALSTGAIEVAANQAVVLNQSLTPPFYINEETEVDESLRLKYRYLDLRRATMQANIELRHKVVKYIRDFLDERGFLEIETPILIKSTPEGARDYLVPSRLQAGEFYALPQSPQQLKQLLMVAGMERYFQIARCFRDEDLRADRQPEFTQLDLEMSFVDEDDVLSLTEELYLTMMSAIVPDRNVPSPMPRITYAEAMARYASDKPDLRFGLEMSDVSELAAQTDFNVFQLGVAGRGHCEGIRGAGRGQLQQQRPSGAGRLRQGARRTGTGPCALGQRPFTGRVNRERCAHGLGAEYAPAVGRTVGATDGRWTRRPDAAHGWRSVYHTPSPQRPARGDGTPARAGRPQHAGLCVRRRLPTFRMGRRRRALEFLPPPLHRTQGRPVALAGRHRLGGHQIQGL